jgi:hypothetical protein
VVHNCPGCQSNVHRQPQRSVTNGNGTAVHGDTVMADG